MKARKLTGPRGATSGAPWFSGTLLATLAIVACGTTTGEGEAGWTSDAVSVTRPSTVPLPKLAFGISDNGGTPGNEDVRALSNWIINEFRQEFHGEKVRAVLRDGKVPLLYFYIAAFTSGLRDCNVGAPPWQTLCHGGANYIRNNMAKVTSIYAATAKELSVALGGKRALVHVEPDWFQYSSGEQSSPLSRDEAGKYMNQILQTIKTACPTCELVADISPWNGELAQWYKSWDLSLVSYGGLVGKRFPPGGVDGKSYATMATALGKPLVVTDVFGPGGGHMGHDFAWDDVATLTKGADDGIAVLVQPANNPAHYRNVIARYRSQAPVAPPAPPTPSPVPTAGPTAGPSAQPPKPEDPEAPASEDSTAPGTSSTEDDAHAENPIGGNPPPPNERNWQFVVSGTINPDWVEVTVKPSSGQGISKVEAIVNGKQWEELSWRSWGTHAKSFHVASGAKVVFRAWNLRGQSFDSPVTRWP